ncbi:MAG: hypothetical protein IJX17_03735 [Clostridia bacterium]|nr:hypothetical protein [Clostridia bacterium]
MKIDDKYKSGEEITQRLFELTGDPRYHNLRVAFEDLRENEQVTNNDNNNGREI